MDRINQNKTRLFLLVVMPLVIAVLGMLWSTSTILDGVSASVDRQEDTRAWQAVQSAFNAAEEHLVGTVTDNAHWDEAARQSYGPIDDKWMFDNWGYATTDINYDTMYIVDAKGKLITSYHKGKLSSVLPESYFGETLLRTLNTLPSDGTTFDAVSTLVNTPDGFTILAAAPILPTSEDFKVPTERPNVLIFTRSLTKDVLVKMSKQYIVDELEVLPIAKSGTAGNILADHWGNPVAVASWQMRHPGDAARQSYSFSALAAILTLIGVMLPISVVFARTMGEMDSREKQARLAARRDSLSGLPNRFSLLEELTKQLATAKPSELALSFVDLDGFKTINDAYDHETGDKLIRAVAAGLSSRVEGQDVLARLGGDEFGILISGKDAVTRSETIAQNILRFVREPFNIDGRIACIGASIGIVALGDEPLEPAEMMRRADIAMYDAKDSGRNRWRYFDDALDLKRSEDQCIAHELRIFIARGELEVAYQPMVDSRSRTIVGVEALARWPTSSPRTLTPDRFIPIAEEHGLINELGALILQMACRDLAQWQDLQLAVNISPLQINNPTLVADIKRIAGEYCLPLTRLEIELTESVLINNSKRAKQVIAELQDCGVTVSLDDFGTGYASVGYLREYAFDKIKLDRSLTQAISMDLATQQVVQGTILIAKGLSTDIIAEGVETEEEAQLMRLAGCQQLQGYYFGKPQAATAMGTMLNQEVVEPVRISA